MMLRIGTRKSPLALWQTREVERLLRVAWPDITIQIEPVVTTGDLTQAAGKPLPEIGGKGVFTAELEEALAEGRIDIAVHALKDLPTAPSPHFTLGAMLDRGSFEDVLVTQAGQRLSELPQGAVIGTSSFRRQVQILRLRPDLKIRSIRGNVGTRIDKVLSKQFDGAIMALAGIQRLGLTDRIAQVLTPEEMLPAPAQGVMAVQCRQNDEKILALLAKIHSPRTATVANAERAFLAALEAGCSTPVACLGRFDRDQYGKEVLSLQGRCAWPDGSYFTEVHMTGSADQPEALGRALAELAQREGFPLPPKEVYGGILRAEGK